MAGSRLGGLLRAATLLADRLPWAKLSSVAQMVDGAECEEAATAGGVELDEGHRRARNAPGGKRQTTQREVATRRNRGPDSFDAQATGKQRADSLEYQQFDA